jgi:hypothetical protein
LGRGFSASGKKEQGGSLRSPIFHLAICCGSPYHQTEV